MLPYNYQYLLIIGCIVSGYAGTYSIVKRKMPGSTIGGLLIIHGSIWTLLYIFQIYSKQAPNTLYLYKLQSTFGYIMPSIFAFYIIKYFEINLKNSKQIFTCISLLPSIASILILFNDPLNLVWKSFSILDHSQFNATLGVFGKIVVAYNYIILLLLLSYFGYTLRRPEQILKLRILAFLFSVILYSSVYTLDILGETPYSMLFAPFVFNVLSSSIVLISTERMYKREVLPIVYRLVIEEMSNPVIVTDRKNKLMYFNEAAKKLLKIEKFLFLQIDIREVFKTLYDYGSDNINNDHFEFFDSIYQVGIYFVEDWQRINRSIIYVLDDVTDIVEYSRSLEVLVNEKTKALLDMERMVTIGKVTSMVGHDLRNPLQVIRSVGNILQEKLIEDPLGFEMVSKINMNILYMNQIVADLQLLTKNRTLEQEEVRLCELLDDASMIIDIPKIVVIISNIPKDTFVYVDSNMFVRVIVNLLNNAVQAMPDGGNIWVDYLKKDGFDLISVRDTGEGISEDKLDEMFKPFFTTKAKGMGLGLSVCKHVAESHDGEMWVESEEGKGSVFYIKIPSKDKLNAELLRLQTVESIQPQLYNS